MYKCKCGNEKYFKETYQVDVIVTIEDDENVSSYDSQNDLIMVTCEVCKDNTEDKSISYLDGEIIEV